MIILHICPCRAYRYHRDPYTAPGDRYRTEFQYEFLQSSAYSRARSCILMVITRTRSCSVATVTDQNSASTDCGRCARLSAIILRVARPLPVLLSATLSDHLVSPHLVLPPLHERLQSPSEPLSGWRLMFGSSPGAHELQLW